MNREYRFESLWDVKAEDTAHIVQLVREGDMLEANRAFDKLVLLAKDRPVYMCFMLARKIKQEAKEQTPEAATC